MGGGSRRYLFNMHNLKVCTNVDRSYYWHCKTTWILVSQHSNPLLPSCKQLNYASSLGSILKGGMILSARMLFPCSFELCDPISFLHTWIWDVKPINHYINIPIFTGTELSVIHYTYPCRGFKKQNKNKKQPKTVIHHQSQYQNYVLLGRLFFKAFILDWIYPNSSAILKLSVNVDTIDMLIKLI